MLDALKFVQGAVAKKDFVQALTHFHISGGFIKGYNGSLALCSPIDLDLEVTPKATPFIKAIATCKDTVQLNMTPAGRLSIKSGSFKAFVDCIDEAYPDVQPEGEILELDGTLLKALKKLNPFIADDASRQWARGIMFRGPSAFATNNVTLVEYWLGYNFPVEVNIPKPAVQELIRIGEEPTKVQVCENSMTFHYASGRWLRTQTYSTQWPDMGKVLDRDSTQQPFPEGFFEALGDLLPFADDLQRVYFLNTRMATVPDDGLGASVDLAGLPEQGIYNIKQLQLLEAIAETIDLSQYPAPCLFYGDRVRGAIVGMRG
jgi:DNA polymerase III sliding clamp (beta) subunit (PCNA family)